MLFDIAFGARVNTKRKDVTATGAHFHLVRYRPEDWSGFFTESCCVDMAKTNTETDAHEGCVFGCDSAVCNPDFIDEWHDDVCGKCFYGARIIAVNTIR